MVLCKKLIKINPYFNQRLSQKKFKLSYEQFKFTTKTFLLKVYHKYQKQRKYRFLQFDLDITLTKALRLPSPSQASFSLSCNIQKHFYQRTLVFRELIQGTQCQVTFQGHQVRVKFKQVYKTDIFASILPHVCIIDSSLLKS